MPLPPSPLHLRVENLIILVSNKKVILLKVARIDTIKVIRIIKKSTINNDYIQPQLHQTLSDKAQDKT